METVTYASVSVQRGWSHVQKAPSATPPLRPFSSEYICLSQPAIYRTGRPCLRFPLLAVMRSCNSLSVSSARSRSISPSLPVSLCLSLSLSPSPSLSLALSPLHKRTKLRQLAYKTADSIIRLHNQDKGDGGQAKKGRCEG